MLGRGRGWRAAGAGGAGRAGDSGARARGVRSRSPSAPRGPSDAARPCPARPAGGWGAGGRASCRSCLPKRAGRQMKSPSCQSASRRPRPKPSTAPTAIRFSAASMRERNPAHQIGERVEWSARVALGDEAGGDVLAEPPRHSPGRSGPRCRSTVQRTPLSLTSGGRMRTPCRLASLVRTWGG